MVFAHAEGVLHAVEQQILVQTEPVIVGPHHHAQQGKLVPVERVIVVLALHALGRQILVQIAHATAVLVQRAPERRHRPVERLHLLALLSNNFYFASQGYTIKEVTLLSL